MWEQMVELEPEEADAGPKNPGAATMLIHIQQTCEHVQLRVVWSWTSVLQILVFQLHTLCGYFAHQRMVVLEGGTGASVQPYTATKAGEGTTTARKVCEELKKQMDMRSLKIVMRRRMNRKK